VFVVTEGQIVRFYQNVALRIRVGAASGSEIGRAAILFARRRVENAGEALTEALRITPPGGLIVVCGSLFLVGEIRQMLDES